MSKEKTNQRKKKGNNKPKKRSFQLIGKERIEELFKQANVLFDKSPKYSNNCVKLARKISLRHKVPFSKEQKILFCKKCDYYLFPSKSSRLRISGGKIIVLCNNCKNLSRYKYK